MTSEYESSENKDLIRREWDSHILSDWMDYLARPLSYLGLPGKFIHDFIDWADYLGRDRTAVEDVGKSPEEQETAKEYMEAIMDRVIARGKLDGFTQRKGTIEDIILNGKDAIHDPLPNSHLDRYGYTRFSYDFVNLDFIGGFGYSRDEGDAKRVEAIKELFKRQRSTGFVLFVTVSLRHTLRDEIKKQLISLRRNVSGESQAVIDWALTEVVGKRGKQNMSRKLKIAVPLLVRVAAQTEVFDVLTYPPITYRGKSSPTTMMHFAFRLEAQGGALPTVSTQMDSVVIGLPLIEIKHSKIVIESSQADLNYELCADALSFLPPELKLQILETMPKK